MTESSAPHGAEADRGHTEVDGGRGSEGVGGSYNMEEVKQIWMAEGANGLESVQKGFEFNSEMNRESVQFFYSRTGDEDVVSRSHCDDASSRVLGHLELKREFLKNK